MSESGKDRDKIQQREYRGNTTRGAQRLGSAQPRRSIRVARGRQKTGTECEQGNRNMGETELSWINEVHAHRDMSYSKHMSRLSKFREGERDKLSPQADGPAKRQNNNARDSAVALA